MGIFDWITGRGKKSPKQIMTMELAAEILRPLESELAALRRNAICLTTQKQAAPMAPATSRLGGWPDAAEGFVWPRWGDEPLSFVAQLNLGELAAFDLDNRLPDEGMLSFFYSSSQEAWGYDPTHHGGGQVIYKTGDLSQFRPAVGPEDLPQEARFPACSLTFTTVSMLPELELPQAASLTLTPEQQEAYDHLAGGAAQEREYTHVLGYPALIQGDMFGECALVTNGLYCGDSTGYEDPRAAELTRDEAVRWGLLLEVGSEESAEMMWGDLGSIYFCIKDEDLAELKFDKTWTILQCF